MITEATGVRYEDIDATLGDRNGRFFGEGYKRIRHRVTDLTVAPPGAAAPAPDGVPGAAAEGGGWATAAASLRYPGDWSTKAHRMDLRPHLSTIDTLLLGIRMSEAYLGHTFGADAGERRRMWLRSFGMRAGARPQEDLDAFRLGLRAQPAVPAAGTLGGHLSTVHTTCGSLRMSAEVDHPVGEPTTVPGHYGAESDLLGPDESRYFCGGYRHRSQYLRDVRVEPDGSLVRASVSVTDDTDRLPRDGFGGLYQPSLSVVDAITVLAQLAQVLIYQQDGVDRAESETLWMRSVDMDSATPYQPMPYSFVATLRIVRTKQLRRGDGVWRMTDVAGDLLGFNVRGSLAHRLPARFTALAGRS
ncbi:AvrD family protein [Actinacidiphila acididurans]|uniref:Avirulence D protein (AvrD) n=1 Tax=Actinacidiphila acididurans TaxID=2784346 RepID=A0ABS2TUS9_9ACTN|nr:AvrD family protein [Actinacidiphila acididurans]MBM9507093.1 hypothetical protein [Actinacidiphila acididurans]